MSSALVRTSRVARQRGSGAVRGISLDLDSFARAAGVHPGLVQRLVRLGLLEPVRDRYGRLYFSAGQVRELARIERLHARACLNYAAIGLVVDLLDRIAELEAALATSSRPREGRPPGGRPWTRTD